MVSRKITKELVSFLRREIGEKKAEYGELYRIKRHALVKKGLPNIPELTIFREPWLSYIAVIKSGSEIRLYYFDTHGVLQHGDSYKHEGETIINELQKKVKRLYRYPIEKKEISIVDVTKQYDKKFSEVWRQVANYLGVTKRIRQNRPVIKVSPKNYKDIFQTQTVNQFIHIPIDSKEQMAKFIYFSFYYLLPEPIKLNEKVGKSVAWRMLLSYKKSKIFLSEESLQISSQFYSLEEWDQYSPKEIRDMLMRLCLYHTTRWEERDLLTLAELSQHEIPSVTRQNLPHIFCKMAVASKNSTILLLTLILAFPFEGKCEGFNGEKNDHFKIYSWLNNREIKKIHNFLNKNTPNTLSKGLHKAIRESLEFLYANILNITSSSQKTSEFNIRNTSDMYITLSDTFQILPDGQEISFPFQEITIHPYSDSVIRFPPDKMSENLCISIRYHLSEEKGGHYLFTGKIVI